MSTVVESRVLAPAITLIRLREPKIARRQRPGQFVIVRATDDGERIPLTIAAADPRDETITLVVQAVGRTTTMLSSLGAGDRVADVAGPLGSPSEIDRFGTVVVVGGGVGVAVALPVAIAMAGAGNDVHAVIGAKTGSSVLFEAELRAVCTTVDVCTDDGSYGRPGLVTDALAEVLDAITVDRVFTAGPIPMMKAVAAATRETQVPTIASLNPIMVDGTGMCGGCRVSVGGVQRFACLDGPEFDAHLVDFDLLAERNRAYRDWEQAQMVAIGSCAIGETAVRR